MEAGWFCVSWLCNGRPESRASQCRRTGRPAALLAVLYNGAARLEQPRRFLGLSRWRLGS